MIRGRACRYLLTTPGPRRFRHACLHLGAGLLRRQELRAASEDRWSGFAASDEEVDAGLEPWEDRLYRDVLRPSDRLLLIGCGAGRDLIALSRLGYDVVGLEPAPLLVAAANAHLSRRLIKARILEGTAESGIVDGEYDVIVFSLYVYSCIFERRTRLATLSRLTQRHLVRGGRLIISYAHTVPQSRLWINLCRLSAAISRSDWQPEAGDRLYTAATRLGMLGFEHQFTRDDLAGECRAAGLQVQRDEAINALYRFAVVSAP